MEMSLLKFICLTLMFFLAHFFNLSDGSSSVSDGIFVGERRLLQDKKSCSVRFEFQNYTIITSRCKGPRYLPSFCCPALKDFACPFVNEINDLSTACAADMFSYITLYGKYPPGLFSLTCREGKEGLACPPLPPSASVSASQGITCGFLSLLSILTWCLLVLLTHFLH